MDDVGLQHVDLVGGEQRCNAVAAGAALAGREPRLDVAADHRERGVILRIARLLEPEQVVGLELARDRDRRTRAEAAVRVDQQIDIGPDALRTAATISTALRIIGRRRVAARVLERIELQPR